MKDYILYIVFRVLSFSLKFLPLEAWLFVGRLLGGTYYYLAGKKKRRAYAHLRRAFPDRTPAERQRILKGMYRRIAQNAFETLYLPWMDEKFIREHVTVKGREFIEEAVRGECGLIFLAVHAGSWELSNVACAIFFSAEGGVSRYAMFARTQSKFKRLNAFLNGLRESRGCPVIPVAELKRMVEHLNNNRMLGVVADHGGREGLAVEFFGKLAMTPVGAVKLAQRLGCRIILAYMHRLKGAHHEMIFKPYALQGSGETSEEVKKDLTQINKVFEEWIRRYPEEYMWLYKRWKYSPQKDLLVLSDGKAGHLKQALSVVGAAKIFIADVRIRVVEIRYQKGRSHRLLSLCGFLFGRRLALRLLPYFLDAAAYRELMAFSSDAVISAGSSLAILNLAVAYENDAKAIAIMRPGIFPVSKFDLVLMPEHDRPPERRNVTATIGSLNDVDAASMKEDFERLTQARPALKCLEAADALKIGVLVGGNSKNYRFSTEMTLFLCQQLEKALQDFKGILLLTTSRRTPVDVVAILKERFKDHPCCKLFVVATEENPGGTVGGIFHLSDVLIVTGESISMVSEAAASGKYVVVFEPHSREKKNKVKSFLKRLSEQRYISLVTLSEIYDRLAILSRYPCEKKVLNTKKIVAEALQRVWE